MSDTPSSIAVLVRHLELDDTYEYILQDALRHRSLQTNHNERLEFLGDSVLNLVISEWLYQRFPHAREGKLSRARAALVKKNTLADMAMELKLSSFVLMAPSEQRSGTHKRTSVLADAMEAIMGAVYLHGGWEKARDLIRRLYIVRMEALPTLEQLKDPKSRLQELLQSRGKHLPQYKLLQASPEEGPRRFRSSCRIDWLEQPQIGWGASRRDAEQDAAARTLQTLSQEHAKTNE